MLKKIGVMFILTVFMFTIFNDGRVLAYNAQLQPFKDEEFDYSREPIYTLAAMGIINGYEDLTYRPANDLSREAFIKLLVTANEQKDDRKTGKLPKDVASNRWSASFISEAYERNWLDGLVDSSGNFYPAQTITRQEVALLVGKALLATESNDAQLKWLDSGWKKVKESRKFRDQNAINSAMQPYVYYAVHRGVMEGTPTGFKPQEPLIRKQAAAVIFRLLDRSAAAKKIDFTGYYAIRSYEAVKHINKLKHMILGWSHLEYSGQGDAKLNTTATVNRIPEGFEEVLDAAKQGNVSRELMVFYDQSNLKDFLKDKEAQSSFIGSLIAVLQDPAYSFTGVSIDFEGLKDAASAPDFVKFLEALKEQLDFKHSLSVAVPPAEYYKGYDMKKIGSIADTVVLMAYDFTHSSSKLPSAPLPLVNEAIVEALQSVPKEKLVLGISKQANQWVTANNGTVSLTSPAIADVEKRLAMPGVTSTWKMPYFLWNSTFTDERGSHEIYYEDTQSIAKKIWLAKFYNLKGVSLWHMGHYTASDWDMIGWETGN
ncbi:glycosyl hydrolase family 18 protein [Paenibacillus sp. GXUN7292]|uniref:glycosyl hydrolase family 18 protein n=1 Tax=Paenibacillus sp. GXUN7292 TaxID=3422499 RepID=UPI003D7D8351